MQNEIVHTNQVLTKQLMSDFLPSITLIVGIVGSVIGYFGKRYYDLESEKVKLRYSIFHKQKIDAINLFISRFLDAELFWTQLPHYKVISSEIKTNELDNLIVPVMNRLTESYYALMVILDDNEISEFTNIINSIFGLKGTISEMRHLGKRSDPYQLVNEFSMLIHTVSSENKISVKKIGQVVKASLS